MFDHPPIKPIPLINKPKLITRNMPANAIPANVRRQGQRNVTQEVLFLTRTRIVSIPTLVLIAPATTSTPHRINLRFRSSEVADPMIGKEHPIMMRIKFTIKSTNCHDMRGEYVLILSDSINAPSDKFDFEIEIDAKLIVYSFLRQLDQGEVIAGSAAACVDEEVGMNW
jgi:hypothetical protein